MKKYKSIYIIIIPLFSVFLFTRAFAQEAIVIHKNVGAYIDSLENLKYILFADYSFDDFNGAQVYKYPENNYKLKIYLKRGEVIEQQISKEEIDLLSSKIRFFHNEYVRGDTSSYYSILLDDGTIINGKILSFTNIEIDFNTSNIGFVNIPTKSVLEINSLNSIDFKADEFSKNPHYSRYFYAPSAIPLDKGEGYFQDIYLLFLSGNYAITNHTTIGAGFSIIPGININEQAFFVNAKIAYQITDKFYLGGGGLFFGVSEASSNIGIGYAVGTYGSKDHNATIGIGYGYTDNKLMETPVFTLCGMTRISKRISLITENWFITVSYDEEIPPDFVDTRTIREFQTLISYGLRFFGDKLSVDFAFINVPTTGELFFPGIPFIDFVVRF